MKLPEVLAYAWSVGIMVLARVCLTIFGWPGLDVDMVAENTDQNDKLCLLPHIHNIIGQPSISQIIVMAFWIAQDQQSPDQSKFKDQL